MKNVRHMMTLAVVFAATALHAQEAVLTPFQAIIAGQMKRYPSMQIQDLYKFTFQAAMGNEHLMTDTSALVEYLTYEWAQITADTSVPLIEYLTPDSELVRLNLRPFKFRHGDPQRLLNAMLTTASSHHPSVDKLRTWWHELEDLGRSKTFPFSTERLHTWFLTSTQTGFQAVHHSAEYGQAYHPAYRVLSAAQVPFLLPAESTTGN